MKLPIALFALYSAVMLLASGCTPPQPATPPSGQMVMTTTIVISNSGATDSIGYRVLIGSDGGTSFDSGDGSGHAVLPAELFDHLKQDVAAAKPLANLPAAASCMKPVSFGTSTFVSVGGDRSPDLTCPADPTATRLKDDVSSIVDFLKIRNVPRDAGKDLPPQNY